MTATNYIDFNFSSSICHRGVICLREVIRVPPCLFFSSFLGVGWGSVSL